ncbi:MAG: hypothetical protein FWF28_11280, partial [Micrococcales bacterium]|nr:hypothetical protein [Micrococcales bacterium]
VRVNVEAETERYREGKQMEAESLLTDAQTEARKIIKQAEIKAEQVRRESDRDVQAALARRGAVKAQMTSLRQLLATPLTGEEPDYGDLDALFDTLPQDMVSPDDLAQDEVLPEDEASAVSSDAEDVPESAEASVTEEPENTGKIVSVETAQTAADEQDVDEDHNVPEDQEVWSVPVDEADKKQ